MLVIELPSRLTADESRSLLDASEQISTSADDVIVDASHVTFVHPIGACVLAAALEKRRRAALRRVRVEPSLDTHVQDFLEEVRLLPFLDHRSDEVGSPAPLDPRAIYAMRSQDLSYSAQVAEWIGEMMQRPDSDTYQIEHGLNEQVQNVFEHSSSTSGCFVLGRWYRNLGNVRLAVVDLGVGIPARIRQASGIEHVPDAELVRRAVTEKGFTTRAGRRGGGLGLKHIHEGVLGRDGRMTVMSGKAVMTFSRHGSPARTTHGFAGLDFRPE